nr:hypothetical protein CFP56_75168 [Quercus suber]
MTLGCRSPRFAWRRSWRRSARTTVKKCRCSQLEDKSKGKEVKSLLEAKGLVATLNLKDAAPKAKDATPKAKEFDPNSKEADPKATNSLVFQPDSKENCPLAKA